jgi:hypothetical protein
MDFLIGITGKDFILVAADCVQARSVVRMKSGKRCALRRLRGGPFHRHVTLRWAQPDLDKMVKLSDQALMLLAGPGALLACRGIPLFASQQTPWPLSLLSAALRA